MTPEKRDQFIANVPDAEQRRQAEKAWQAHYISDTKFTAASSARGLPAIEPDQDRDALIASFQAAIDADPELTALATAADDAAAEWERFAEYGEPLEGEDGEIIRCSLTGFLVHEHDNYLIDVRTHEAILKTALGLPLGFIVGEFRSDDAPAIVLSDDALSAAEAIANVG